jgi:glycosyltransferase A (GT-A) superfamily protein (DUF2064 family)
MTTIVILAKEPVPGRVKTRLHPPLSLEEAAELAAAALLDTVHAVLAMPASRRVIAYDGVDVPHPARSFERIDQVAGSLDERLAAIFDELDGPTVLIGMDTPQVTAHSLAPVFEPWPRGVGAWFGPAEDGGFWALGMREPRGDVIRGVAMSREDTGAVQFERMRSAGLGTALLPRLTDVDDIATARLVAREAPHTAFARALTEIESRVRS